MHANDASNDEQRRQRIIEQYRLGAALMTAEVENQRVTIHRQSRTHALWIITVSAHGTGASSIEPGIEVVGWTQIGSQRIVYGLLPPSAVAAEVMTDWKGVAHAQVVADIFMAVVPLVGAALVSFKNTDGYVVRVQPIVAWQPITRPRLFERIRFWLQEHNVWLAPRHTYTYPKNTRSK